VKTVISMKLDITPFLGQICYLCYVHPCRQLLATSDFHQVFLWWCGLNT